LTDENVFLAIIDKDLKIRTLKKYPLSKNGQQIHVVSGGEGHFMPQISNTSYLEVPLGAKKFILFGVRAFRRVYFAMNKATKCIDFASGDVALPSPEELKKAIGSTMLGQIGKDKVEVTWRDWAILILSFLTFLIVLNMSGMLR